MMLRHWVWAALTGTLLTVSPATASPSDSTVEPAQRTATAAGPEKPAPSTVGVPAAATANPGAITGESAPQSQSQVESSPAALQIPDVEPEPPKPVITLHVEIDLSKQRMTVREGDQVLHVWPISSGTRGYITPNGTYQPQWRSRMWRSKQYYGSPMPHSIFFHRGYAIHGTYATGMLGRPASHGCVRLAPKHAATLYKLVDTHGMQSTQIVVHGKTNVGSPRVASGRSGSRSRQASRWRAPSGYASFGYSTGYGAPWW